MSLPQAFYITLYIDCIYTLFRFLVATEQLYLREGQRLTQDRDVPQYLLHVDKRLTEENNRVLHYLDMSTK